MLDSARLVAFVATTDADRARDFYQGTLGLELIEDSPFALAFDVAGTMLRVQKVASLAPPEYTVLGWRVDDIRAAAADLAAKGIRFERFGGMEQDDAGVWTSPGGARVAWFRDPEGHILSLTQAG